MAITKVEVQQDIKHGGTNNNSFSEKQLTYYDDDKIKSVEGTKVTVDEDDNPLLHIDKADIDNETVDNSEIENATIETLTVNGNTLLNGNLTVKGTHTEEHTQDLFVGSDTITLRDGSNTALTEGEYSGLIINKYDGNDSLGLVTTNDGTLKVGELNLQYVYWTTDSESEKYGKYFSDFDLTTEIEIPDDKTVYSESEDTTKKLAKGYYIVKDDTQTIATRSDSSEITDGNILYFDGTTYKLVDSGVGYKSLNDLANKLREIVGDDKIIITKRHSGYPLWEIYGKNVYITTDIKDFSKYFEYLGPQYTDRTTYEYQPFGALYVTNNSTNEQIQVKSLLLSNTDVEVDGCVIEGYKTFEGELVFTEFGGLRDFYYFTTTGLNITLKDDNKIYYTDDLDNFDVDSLKEGNYITTPNSATNSESVLAISDKVEEGNYNIVTSDALFNYLEGWSPDYDGSWVIENGNIRWVNN